MSLYVALLRGINVSGQKKILMADLRVLFAEAGFAQVQTYIQSGNVIFGSPKTSNVVEIKLLIEQAIERNYSYHVAVTILAPEEIKNILHGNPFVQQNLDITKLGVTLLSDLPSQEQIMLLDTYDFTPDEFIYQDKLVYVYYPNGFGRSKLTNNFFESKLKRSATSRNWKTMLKLHELSSQVRES